MAPRRYIHRSDSEDPRIWRLSWHARYILHELELYADDHGVVTAEPAKVRARMLPLSDLPVYREDEAVSGYSVEAALYEIAAQGLLWAYIYEGDGERYARLPQFEQRQGSSLGKRKRRPTVPYPTSLPEVNHWGDGCLRVSENFSEVLRNSESKKEKESTKEKERININTPLGARAREEQPPEPEPAPVKLTLLEPEPTITEVVDAHLPPEPVAEPQGSDSSPLLASLDFVIAEALGGYSTFQRYQRTQWAQIAADEIGAGRWTEAQLKAALAQHPPNSADIKSPAYWFSRNEPGKVARSGPQSRGKGPKLPSRGDFQSGKVEV